MLKLRSIATRLILAISVTVAVAAAVLGTFSLMTQRSLTQIALERELKLQYDSVIAALEYEGRAALAVTAVVAAMPPVQDAVAHGDRDALLALLGDSQKALTKLGLPQFNFETPPATMLLRVRDPKSFGDDISARRTTIVENRTGPASRFPASRWGATRSPSSR
jgi:methyl-accepting chemotaxis protein